MRKLLLLLTRTLVLFFMVTFFNENANAQNLVADAQSLVNKNAAAIGLSADDLKNARISDTYIDKISGATLVYLQRTYKGIDVYNQLLVLAFKNGKPISALGNRSFAPAENASGFSPSSAISSTEAVKAALSHLKIAGKSFVSPLSIKPGASKESEFGNLGVATNNIKAKLVWMVSEINKQLLLSWHVEVQPIGQADYWVVKVNAQNGTILEKSNYTVYDNWGTPEIDDNKVIDKTGNIEQRNEQSVKDFKDITTATYRVVKFPAESPIHPGGTPSLHADPWTLAPAGSDATTLLWNYDGTTYFDSTRGNNVVAQEDHNANNGFGIGGHSQTAEPSLLFDYPPNFTLQPTDSVNLGFANTNLFYWNNIMHDISYQYGFDEVSGNFQKNNLGRGGIGNDFVFADAQDGSGTNNANFSTPPDGSGGRMQMYLFTTKNPKLDGDLDNGVISHEYTHGISNRLTGGPNNTSCLSNREEGGEGWSDYFAIMITTNWATAQVTDGSKPHPIGNYVLNKSVNGGGIRIHPYSTDMSIDPWTYAGVQTSGGEVHDIGEIWCTVLWDMTWAIIQKDGINPDIYNAAGTGGNSVAFKLVTEGMKLQKCSPGFLDARDGILKADTLLYSGAYSCIIWEAFAKRGMGVNAKQGSSNSTSDQVEDFSSYSIPSIVKHEDKSDAGQGELINYTFHITASPCNGITDYKIVDTLSSAVTYVASDGTYNNADRTVTFSGITLNPGESKDLTLAVITNAGSYFDPIEHINEDFAGSTIPDTWKNTSTTATPWKLKTTRSHSSPNAVFGEDVIDPTNSILATKNSYTLKGVSTLSFWHYYDLEPGYDGGVVEISTDNGSSWIDAGPYMLKNGYNGAIDPTDNDTQLKGRSAFTDKSGGFVQTIVNLTSFAGKDVSFRFVFATDVQNQGLTFEGWYLDDIVLQSEAGVFNEAKLFDIDNHVQGLSDTLATINSETLSVSWGNFTVEKVGKTALLKWNTLQEINADKFIVERSADNSSFAPIATIAAKGNTTALTNYNVSDGAPIPGINFYRIKEVDKDGKYSYSEVRTIDFTGAPGTITISPNPAHDKVTITIAGNTKTLQVYLLNAAGQQIKTFTMNTQGMQINLPHLAPGVYYIRIAGENFNSKHKLVIE